MSVKKRTYNSGKTVWYFIFDAPGSTRANRRQIKESGFATKNEARNAEAGRRVEEQKKYELTQARSVVDAPLPKTLGALLKEFFQEHAEKKLAPKTVERYREQAGYLAQELLEMPLEGITALHLGREWNRLLESGGHHRKTKAARSLSAKTVRNIAGVVSSAFARAIRWGLVTSNPVQNSEPPVARRHRGVALTVAQQETLVAAATSPWCLPVFLGVVAATACRRGEILALRWSDIRDGRATIARSLCQTKGGALEFKTTKTATDHDVKIPDSALATLEAHRKRQESFRIQFGPDYCAELDLIFANPDGSPLRPDSISAAVSALFRRLKLPKGASLHSLRHSHASQLLDDGVPLPVVSQRLGHSSVRVTADIYSHAMHGQDDEAARRWDQYQKRQRAAGNLPGPKPV
jgi:integrase